MLLESQPSRGEREARFVELTQRKPADTQRNALRFGVCRGQNSFSSAQRSSGFPQGTQSESRSQIAGVRSSTPFAVNAV